MECGIPFREAHFITGQCVKYAESRKEDLSTINPDDLAVFLNKEILKTQSVNAEKLKNTLDLYECMQRRNSLGGCNFGEVKRQIEVLRGFLLSSKDC